MGKRWLIYLGTVVGALVFYWAYRQWLAWLILVGILCLPVADLALSLVPMLSLKMTVDCPPRIPLGGREILILRLKCPLPRPPVRGRVRVQRVITGEEWTLTHGEPLPGEHCGLLTCRPEKARVYDYLGLFFLRLRQTGKICTYVYPAPVPMPCVPELERYLASAWRPKPGGGFAENHEVRLYRPGDSLNQIHWKLSAKVGRFMIREAMVPQSRRILLSLVLRGTPEMLDHKLGQLLWLSRELLQKQLSHEICVLTAEGLLTLGVSNEEELNTAMDTVLAQRPAPAGAQMPALTSAWQYRIGGDSNEG